MDEIAVLPGARELLVALRERGHRVVLASSGKPQHVDRYLDLLDARDVAEAWTTSDDVEATKPAPDLLQVALEKLGEPADARQRGDRRLGVRRGGGEERGDAGARRPLGRLRGRRAARCRRRRRSSTPRRIWRRRRSTSSAPEPSAPRHRCPAPSLRTGLRARGPGQPTTRPQRARYSATVTMRRALVDGHRRGARHEAGAVVAELGEQAAGLQAPAGRPRSARGEHASTRSARPSGPAPRRSGASAGGCRGRPGRARRGPQACSRSTSRPDLDAVAGDERHLLQHRPAAGVLPAERLDEAGQLGPQRVEQRAGGQLGDPAAAGRAVLAVDVERAGVAALDVVDPAGRSAAG